jgi:ATP-dependent DNA helicase RecG
MANNPLLQKINIIAGVSDKIEAKINKIGIYSVLDLLLYQPINILVRKQHENIKTLQPKDHAIIALSVVRYAKTKSTTRVLCVDSNGDYINLIYFKMYPNYLERYLPIGQNIIISGVVDLFDNLLCFNHPKVLKSLNEIKLIEPIYRAKEDITSYKFSNFILQALNFIQNINLVEWLDEEFLKQNNLPSFTKALYCLHNPTSQEDLEPLNPNIIRLAIDEMLAYHITLLQAKIEQKNTAIIIKSDNSLIKPLLKNLPFELTGDQINAVKTIKEMFLKPKQNTFLLQGDVGSGKTIVCFIASLFALESEMQVAFVAPTDILANQHYNNFLNYAKGIDINIKLLVGKTKKSEKLKIYDDLNSGKINIIVATHAVFEDVVQFNNLGLVVIDEQHRFGVNQRLKLINKGQNPNIILTTATPIPRTLALSYYGDIDTIEIKEKPKNRKDIITKTISSARVEELIEYVKKAIEENQKVFWVCPLVEESEKLDLMAANERYEKLQNELANNKVFLVHGKLKKEKDEIINNFKNLTTGAVLVATTVIEVGIDIPTCNIMIIEEAQRFGLAQLHQLRGRVGRGSEQGYCFLLYNSNTTQNAKKRLNVIKNSNDGFYIAQQDLELRGYGDVLGVNQSGFEYFQITNLAYHGKYLEPTIKYAKMLLENKNNKNKVEALLELLGKNSNYFKIG